MDDTKETLADRAVRILTEELPAATIEEVKDGVEPLPKRFKMDKALLEMELSDMFFGNMGTEGETHRTVLEGIDISPILQGITFVADIHGVNHAVLHLIGIPAKLRTVAMVELASAGLDEQADQFMARYEEKMHREAEEEAAAGLAAVEGSGEES